MAIFLCTFSEQLTKLASLPSVIFINLAKENRPWTSHIDWLIDWLIYILFSRDRRNMSERLVGSRANWRLLCLNLQLRSTAILFPRSMVWSPNRFAWMVSLVKKFPKVQELICSWWQLDVSCPLFQESHNQEK